MMGAWKTSELLRHLLAFTLSSCPQIQALWLGWTFCTPVFGHWPDHHIDVLDAEEEHLANSAVTRASRRSAPKQTARVFAHFGPQCMP